MSLNFLGLGGLYGEMAGHKVRKQIRHFRRFRQIPLFCGRGQSARYGLPKAPKEYRSHPNTTLEGGGKPTTRRGFQNLFLGGAPF